MVKGWSNFDMVGHLMMAFFLPAAAPSGVTPFSPAISCRLIIFICANEIIFCVRHHPFYPHYFAY
ncbi:hypothetical protein KONIH1_08590 [Klebsiella oxytoca KONIH1]|nr:hypothetical protein KONIH1_08590 [Klebsiella oxytoca KONIH1]